MATPLLSIIITFFFISLPPAAPAQSPLTYYICNPSKFLNGTSYHRNLNTVLATLTTLSSLSLYNVTSLGSTRGRAGKVYGVFQCRGDLTASNCSTCLPQIVNNIEQLCPFAVGARVQLEHCFLRYENYTFFTPDFLYLGRLVNAVNNSDEGFQHNLDNLTRAALNAAPEQGGFYDEAAGDGSTNRVYLLAQCLGYLSPNDCKRCLTTATSFRSSLGNASGAQLYFSTCYYRYESYLFFQGKPLAPAASPSPSYLPPPAPSYSPASSVTSPSAPSTESPSYSLTPSPSSSPGNIITGLPSSTAKSPSQQGSLSGSKPKPVIVAVLTLAALLSWLFCCP